MTLTRATSSLPADVEQLITDTIGCCVAAHRALSPGPTEGAYGRACGIELSLRGIPFETERAVAVHYRNQLVSQQRIDLFVDRRLILEIESVERIHPVHVAQTVSYMRARASERAS